MKFKKLIVKSLLVSCLLVGLPFHEGLVYAQEKVKVNFWHAMGGWRIEVIDRMVADFNLQHPGIEVKAEFKGGYDETFIATMAAAKAGKAPHVVMVVQYSTQEAIDSGIFGGAEELLNRFGFKVNWADYIDQVLHTYRVGGKLYSFPWASSTSVLFYNKTMLDKAGQKLPYKPTFNDIIQVGRTLVKGGHTRHAITWPLHYWFVEQWMAQAGQNLVDNDNGWSGRPTKANLTSDAVKKIYEWWKQLNDERLWVNPGRVAWGEAVRIFVSGEAAMFISSTAHVALLQKEASEKGFQVATTYIPILDGTKRNGCSIGGGTLWITKDHPDKELKAATEFVFWLSETAQTIRWHQNTGYFPVKKTAVDALKKEGWFVAQPNYKTAFDQLLETVSIPATRGAVFGGFREVIDHMETGFEKIVGGEPVPKALADMSEKATKSIKEYQRLERK